MSQIINVILTGVLDCDLCMEHYLWECPNCKSDLDHFQVSEVLEVECSCGVISKITTEEQQRWRIEILGLNN